MTSSLRISDLAWLVVLGGWAVVEHVSGPAGALPHAAGAIVAATATVLPVAMRRAHPVAAVGVFAAGVVVLEALGLHTYYDFTPWQAFPLLCWEVGRRVVERRDLGAALAALEAIYLAPIAAFSTYEVAPASLALGLSVAPVAVFAGRMTSRLHSSERAVRARERAIVAERDARLRAAVAAERAALERGLAGLVRDSAADLVAQSRAAGAAIATGELAAAQDHAERARAAAVAALDQMRDLLAALAPADASPRWAAAHRALSGPRWALRHRRASLVIVAVPTAVATATGVAAGAAGWVVGVGVLAGVALLARERWPTAAVLGAAACLLVPALLGAVPADDILGPAMLAVAAGWTAGAEVDQDRRALALGATVIAVLAVLLAVQPAPEATDFFVLCGLVAIAVAAARTLRRHGIALAGAVRSHGRVMADEERRHRRAAAVERQRVRRELHDQVGGALTLASVHAGLARVTAVRDPAAAAGALRHAVDGGVAAVAELQTLFGGLPEDAAAGPPSIAELAERVRATGALVRVDDDRSAPCAPAVERSLRGIVQEALVNATKHAPGAPITVHVHDAGDAVHLAVRNVLPVAAGSRDGSRLGLVGMRERARLHGGDVRAGRDGDTWLVEATLPRSP